MQRHSVAVLAAGFLSIAAAAPALAVVAAPAVPSAIAYASYSYNRMSVSGPVTSYRVDGDGSATLVAQTPGSPTPGLPNARTVVDPLGFVSLSSELTSASDYHSFGNGYLGYSVRIGGSGYTGVVPIHLIASLAVSATGNSSTNVAVGDANLYVSSNAGSSHWRAALCTSGCVGAQPSNVSIDTIVNARVGEIITITESVSTEAINGGSASAYADPYLYIDQAFLADHPTFSLQFSPFVGNDPAASTAPEPASWAMMVGGFGMMGAAMRRRRRAAIGFA